MITQPHLLIFIAGQNELEAFCNHSLPESKQYQGWSYYRYQPQVSLVHCRIGSFNALACAEAIIPALNPSHCLNIGFSGSHSKDLDIGQVVLATSTIAFDYHTKTAQNTLEIRSQDVQKNGQTHQLTNFESDTHLVKELQKQLSHTLHLTQGLIGSSNQFNRSLEFIQQVRDVFGTDCEDMESAAIAYSAFRHHVPFAALRVISNNELQDKTQQGRGFDPMAFQSLSLLGKAFTKWTI